MTFCFTVLKIAAIHTQCETNALIEKAALRSKGDADHIRNLSQMIAHVFRLIGGISLSVMGSVNYWKNMGFHLGKTLFLI
jgi:hypothetical protein